VEADLGEVSCLSFFAENSLTLVSPNEQVDEFAKLASMGVKILPLVVYKLCSETEGTAVKLCKLLPIC
jgi:hypothetical protein